MVNGRTNYKYTINEYYNYALCGFQSKRHFSSGLGKEIELAEAEMPGLMALRAEYKDNPKRSSYRWMFTHDNPNCCINRNFNCSWC
jgi:hypothetical protein